MPELRHERHGHSISARKIQSDGKIQRDWKMQSDWNKFPNSFLRLSF